MSTEARQAALPHADQTACEPSCNSSSTVQCDASADSSHASLNGASNRDAVRARRYQALLSIASHAAWSWSRHKDNSDFQSAIRWWAELTGQTADELATQDGWLDAIHVYDRAAVESSWAEAQANHCSSQVTFRAQSRWGGWRYVRARAAPIFLDNGELDEWIGTFEDITDQQTALQERELLLAQSQVERRHLDDIFHHAHSFIAVLRGPEHVFEQVNDRYLELIGRRSVIGLPVRQALPEIEGQGYYELLDKVYSTGQAHTATNANVVLQSDSGQQTRILEFAYQPMFDIDGKVSGVLCQGIDQTERMQAEERVRMLSAESSRQRRIYETALSNTADFVYVFNLDGRFTYINRALLDLLGISAEDAMNKNFFDLNYPPPLAEKLQDQIQEVIKTGKPLRDETPYTSAKGTESYEYIFVPVFGTDGSVEAVVGSTRQITDRKRIEIALRESEQRHRALVTATSDVVYRMSADWSVMYPLDGRSLVASNLEPISDWLEKNIPAPEIPKVKAAYTQAVTHKSTFQLEHQVVRQDGSIGWTFSRAVPIVGQDGEIIEWFGTASDVTRRKQAEEELLDMRSRMEAALSAGAIGTWTWDIPADRFYGDASLFNLFALQDGEQRGVVVDHYDVHSS